MSNFKLHIKSTSVDGVYGIVDLLLNDAVLVNNLQLSDTVTEFEYEVDVVESYTLTVNLLNDRARDVDGDSDFSSDVDEVMQVIITLIELAESEGNYRSILPQEGITTTVPEGYVESGIEIQLIPEVSEFTSFGNSSIEFNSEKILSVNAEILDYNEVIGDSIYTNGILAVTGTPI